jgi:hypothetical protein
MGSPWWRKMYLNTCEGWMEAYQSVDLVESILLEVEDHEGFRRSVVLAAESMGVGRLKAEAGIVTWVAKHDHDSIPLLPALFQALPYESRSDALVLVLRENRQRGKAGDPDLAGRLGDTDWGEEDVADDLPVQLNYQGHDHCRLAVQLCDQIRLSWPAKSGFVDRVNGLGVDGLLRSNKGR